MGDELATDIRVLSPKLPLIMLTGDPYIPESARRTVDAVFIKGTGHPRDLLEAITRLTARAFTREN